MCGDILDDWFGIDPDTVDTQPTAEQVAAKLRKEQEAAQRQAILDSALDSDRRRGRGASVVAGSTFGYGGNIVGQNPVGLATPASRTMLGR